MICQLLMKSLIKFLIYSVVTMSNSEDLNRFPIVLNTWPWTGPTLEAYKVLENNGSLLDALVAGCTNAEEDRSIPTVGWGGSPSENGETALDALIMDGLSHNVGAVASMKRIKNAIAVARHVMENTKHTLLVGEDATKFATQMGFREEDLSSNESIAEWKNWTASHCQPNFWQNVSPDPKISCGPYTPAERFNLHGSSVVSTYSEGNHDTIGLLAVNSDGNIAAATSTNGAKFKITGRVGDSPIAGSGAYVDNDIGAAAATGDGDIMMRFLPSYQVVENMRAGMNPTSAAEEALRRIIKYHKQFQGALIAVDKNGEYGAACYGWTFQYAVINPKLGSVSVIDVLPISPKSF